MPLLYIKEVHSDVKLGLWRMTETADEIAVFAADLPDCKYKSESRRREYYCVRMLLKEMLGSTDCPVIIYDDNGKPSLSDGRNISISHTRGYCSVIISNKYNVAVDIEAVSNRVDRIANKFLRQDEQAETTDARLLHWCAKETMYKLFSSDKLAFEEMRVIPFNLSDSGNFTICNLRSNISVDMVYSSKPDYMLVYSTIYSH